MVHPEDRDRVNSAFVESIGKPGSFIIEHRLLLPDGRIKFVEERWRSFNDASGRPVRALGTCQDITEGKRAEEALRASEERFRLMIEGSEQVIFIPRTGSTGLSIFLPPRLPCWALSRRNSSASLVMCSSFKMIQAATTF